MTQPSECEASPLVESFFDPATWTFTHVVHAGRGSACALVDPVLDYDPRSGRTSTRSADRVIEFVKAQGLKVEWILETHAHADHLTAAAWIKRQIGGQIAIGSQITAVQSVFRTIFNLESSFVADGSQFDRLLVDGDTIQVGSLRGQALHVPGHTPACMAYRFGDAVFVGDTIFMPDVGTARCDFPGGDARTLYASIQRLLSLPGETRLFLCHDYPPQDRPLASQTTVAAERAANIHVHTGIDEASFVRMRTERDATLDMPALLLPAIQINIRAGDRPPAEPNGIAYLKMPLDAL